MTGHIPSDDEFASARQKRTERSRNLETARVRVLQHLRKFLPVYDLYILSQRDVDFRAYVFFNRDDDLQAYKGSEVLADIENCVYEQLELAGRGTRGEIRVAFEYDSDENVKRNYEGNYYLRLL